ncbi:nitrilase-related carbon-nitrogen hydrolase [Cupriavidus basilensis]
MKTYPSSKAAACHAAPIYFNTPATVDKACAWIAEAAGNGAELIAFPEAFISSFPVWSGVWAPVGCSMSSSSSSASSAVEVNGPEVGQIRDCAKRHGVFVSLGINEGTPISPACIWDTNILIGDDGSILNAHHASSVSHVLGEAHVDAGRRQRPARVGHPYRPHRCAGLRREHQCPCTLYAARAR